MSTRTRAIVAVAVFTVLLLGAATVAAQEPGSLVSVERVGRWSNAEIEARGEPLFDWYGVPEATYAVEEYLVWYWTRDFDGTPVQAKSQLFFPILSAHEARPVLMFGSGTTGVDNSCAPSLGQSDPGRWGYYRTNMASYASQGIITIFPDYIGFNDDERMQRYFSKTAEAHLLLDGYRAVMNVFESERLLSRVTPADAAFTAGYSQGGHAAFAAADLVADYAPDVPLRGAIGFAATANVMTLMQEAAYYSPYIIAAYRDMYGDEIDPARYLRERFVRTFDDDVAGKCVKEMEQYYPFYGEELFTPAFYDALHNGRLEAEYPELYRRLEENLSGLDGHGIPVLNVQGGEDIIITSPAQMAYSAELCETGVTVQYEEYDDARHRHTRPAGFRSSVAWIEAIFAGEAPLGNCDSF